MTPTTDTTVVYQVLTPEDMERIRRERVLLIEADLYRAYLQLEESQSDTERKAVLSDIIALRSRLQPHYRALGLGEAELEDPHDDKP